MPAKDFQFPVVEIVGSESRELAGKVDPKTLAAQLKEVRDAFLEVLNQQDEAGTYALKSTSSVS